MIHPSPAATPASITTTTTIIIIIPATIGKKAKSFPYSLPSVGPGADPGVQAVSPQVT